MTVTADRDAAFLAGIGEIAETIAAVHADDVDRNARFPIEAVTALREQRAFSALVGAEHGGDGVSFRAIAEACFTLGRRCAATAMVFAMHQIQVATIVRHSEGSAHFEEYLRALVAEQRLIASVTSEVGTGGDMSRSVAALTPAGEGRLSFEKQAPTVSYGAHADDLFTTLRRSPDAEPNDQVIVLTTKAQTTLTPTGSWDPLGMRGTCSPGYVATAAFAPEQVLPVPFAQVSAESMVPVSHLLWAHLWSGIASEAFERARAFVRAAASRTGSPASGGRRLSAVSGQLTRMRAEIAAARAYFEQASEVDDRPELSTMAAALRFNSLKIGASEAVADICLAALAITGFMGYKNDSPFSVGRHIRDALSASVMVANERLHESNAALLLVVKDA